MSKRCVHCGRYFTPDKRVGQRQKVCQREQCKLARKKQAQQQWQQNNPKYFDNLYLDYVKPWRQRRKEIRVSLLPRQVIKDEIPPSKPLQELILLIPGDIKGMIKDEIRLRRLDSHTFAAYGP